VIQDGTTSLVFVDKSGGTSPGYWTSPTQVFATAWNSTATVGHGTLTWADGTVWNENLVLNGAVGGTGSATISASPSQVFVNDYVNGAGKVVHVVLTGTTNLVFIDSQGKMALGTWLNATQATSSSYPGDVATFSGNKVSWTDGAVWTQVASTSSPVTVTDYVNPYGLPAHIVQNGTNSLVFVDGLGRTSLGTWLNSTQAIANAYPNDKATFSGTKVTWDDGFVWTQSTTLPLVVTFTAPNGSFSRIRVVDHGTVLGLVGPLQGKTGTRLNGKITWSNGTVWNDFDFNALNALFQMSAGYP
jgi:hypothetical protein